MTALLIPVLAIVGPTGVGKSSLALSVGERVGGEIISADSIQLYRGMDVGTAKPTAADLARVPHHMIDVREPGDYCSAGDYAREAARCIAEVHGRGRRVLVVGGSGLYIRALLRGLSPEARDDDLRRRLRAEAAAGGSQPLHDRLARLDPASAARISPSDSLRICRALEVIEVTGRRLGDVHAEGASPPPYDVTMVALTMPRRDLYARIDARVDAFMRAGFLDEVHALLASGVDPDCPAMQAIGYRDLARHLRGECILAEAVRLTKRNTRRFAKRQLTWFRGEGDALWIDLGSSADPVADVLALAGF